MALHRRAAPLAGGRASFWRSLREAAQGKVFVAGKRRALWDRYVTCGSGTEDRPPKIRRFIQRRGACFFPNWISAST